MKKLLQLVSLAIAALQAHRQAMADKDTLIAELKGQLADDKANDEKLNARISELETSAAEADDKADQLATALNSEPAVQNVNPETFAVTGAPTATANDLAFRERAAETGGVAPGSDLPPAPTPVPPADQAPTPVQTQAAQDAQGQQQAPPSDQSPAV